MYVAHLANEPECRCKRYSDTKCRGLCTTPDIAKSPNVGSYIQVPTFTSVERASGHFRQHPDDADFDTAAGPGFPSAMAKRDLRLCREVRP